LLKAEAQPEPKSVRLGFVAGMIAQEKLTPFERLLFRATRGNMFLKNSGVGAVLDPTTSEKQEKAVFVVFFAGDRARTKILKVCSSVPNFGVIFLYSRTSISGTALSGREPKSGGLSMRSESIHKQNV
jgi:hypothetical protein